MPCKVIEHYVGYGAGEGGVLMEDKFLPAGRPEYTYQRRDEANG